MQIKIHKAYRPIVALADSNLIGKSFEDNKRQIKIKPEFFKGEERGPIEVKNILKDMSREDATFNIVGEESTETAIEIGIIKPEGIIKIDNVPVALSLL